MMKNMVRNGLCALVAISLMGIWGCSDLQQPNTNNPSIDELTENPTRAAVLSAAQGLMITTRQNSNGAAGVVSTLGIVGRESYNLDVADPRWSEELLASDLDPGNFGRFMWSAPYESIRQANLILEAVPQVADAEMPAAEKEAVQGFAKTIQAYDFLQVINTRDTNGAPIDVGGAIDAPVAPLEGKRAVFDHIVALLEQGNQHLQSAGATFPFSLSSGFADFDTPESFRTFNRALRARVAVYMAGEFDEESHYQTALDALSESFIDDAPADVAALNAGVYHAFSGTSGDATNALFEPGDNPNIRAHPSVADSVEMQTDGTTPDARFVRKTRPITFADFAGNVAGSSTGFSIYDAIESPIPVIRNEELILLRAEAHLGQGSVELAEDDINLIRDISGNLPDVDLTTEEEALDQLLYEKKYSLLFEGGHHWIDMRRYDRLDDLPLDQADHQVHARWPIPQAECDARDDC